MTAHENPGLSDAPRLEYHRDLIEVQIESDVVAGLPTVMGAAMTAMRGLPEAISEPLRALRTSRYLREVTPVFASEPTGHGALPMGAAMVANAFVRSVRETDSNDLSGIVMLRLSSKANLNAVRKDLDSTRGVKRAHLVPVRWLDAAEPDPLQNRQWGLRATHWFERELPNAKSVGVAVLDTGIDESHPDLHADKYFHDGTSATDIVGHGTHVSGIITAIANNKVGISGVAQCRLSVYKIFGDRPASNGHYYVDPLMYRRALNAVRTSGDRIVNLSIGGTAEDPTETLLFSRLQQAGVLAVAAMGNDFERGNPVEYPGAFKDVVAVGATTEANQRSPFSNTGSRITIAAPGSNILSTLPMTTSTQRPAKADTEYAAWSGTSMATPHVAGALALLLAAHPDMSAKDAVAKLTKSATRLPQMRTKRTEEFGAGLLNIRDLLI